MAVLSDSTLYPSAISPTDPNSPLADQTHSAMRRLGEILGMAGIDYPQVVSCHVQLSDMENYAAMNEVHGSYFPEGGYPARTTLEFPGLPEKTGVLQRSGGQDGSGRSQLAEPVSCLASSATLISDSAGMPSP